MFKLSKKTEYCILALRHLAEQSDKSATVKGMAQELRISQSLLAKLLQELARCKIVGSIQGAHGGYRLLAELGRLSLADVVEIVEGPIELTACSHSERPCERQQDCDLKKSIGPVGLQVRSVLETIKVADL